MNNELQTCRYIKALSTSCPFVPMEEIYGALCAVFPNLSAYPFAMVTDALIKGEKAHLALMRRIYQEDEKSNTDLRPFLYVKRRILYICDEQSGLTFELYPMGNHWVLFMEQTLGDSVRLHTFLQTLSQDHKACSTLYIQPSLGETGRKQVHEHYPDFTIEDYPT